MAQATEKWQTQMDFSLAMQSLLLAQHQRSLCFSLKPTMIVQVPR
jgi:hypothetical protein